MDMFANCLAFYRLKIQSNQSKQIRQIFDHLCRLLNCCNVVKSSGAILDAQCSARQLYDATSFDLHFVLARTGLIIILFCPLMQYEHFDKSIN